jgi:hypothetical protein
MGMKVKGDEGGGRILLGDNTGHGAIMLRTMRFSVLEFRFQLHSLLYTKILDHMHNQFTQNLICAEPS